MIKKKISRMLILGTAQLGSNYGIKKKYKNKKTSYQIINTARRKNIKFLDMADSYINSLNILKISNLKNWKVCFKISNKTLLKNNKGNYFLNYFFKSLKDFKINNYEYFLFHNVSSLKSKFGEKIYETLNILKRAGFIKKIGVALYSPDEVEFLINKFQIDVVQVPINIFDQRFLNKNLLFKLKKKNIEIHARSIFLQGLVTFSSKNLPKKFKRFENIFSKWEFFLKKNNSNAIRESLKFILAEDKVDKIVVGFDHSDQLLELLSYKFKKINTFYSKFKSKDLRLIDPRKW